MLSYFIFFCFLKDAFIFNYFAVKKNYMMSLGLTEGANNNHINTLDQVVRKVQMEPYSSTNIGRNPSTVNEINNVASTRTMVQEQEDSHGISNHSSPSSPLRRTSSE